MAVLSRNDFMNVIKGLLGDDTSDEALKQLEDMSDTIDDYERRISADDEEIRKNYDALKQQYDELDTSWRQRYRDRFYSQQEIEHLDDKLTEQVKTEETITIEDLFKERSED